MTPHPEDCEPETRPGSPSRRRFLGTSVLAAAASLLPRVGAGAATKTTKKTTKTTVKKATSAPTSAPTSKAAATTAKAPATPATKAPKATGPSFDAAQELLVSFTYSAAGGFRVTNPYVAVYVIDDAGNLVRTIDLSINTSGKGLRYVNELRYWYQLDQTAVATGAKELIGTVSGATRLPGTYKFTWDGKDQGGALVSQGTYVLCIESSREHGPYELITEPIVLDGKPFVQKPADQGSLTAVSVELRARS